jgi:VWFA-related protein
MMDTQDAHICGRLKILILIISVLWFLAIAISNGQERHIPAETNLPEGDFAIRIGVEEVRIDAVVLDNKGRQIPDLTENDFEVYQDNQRQRVTACAYIKDNQARSGMVQEEKAAGFPVPIRREEVRRTIVFIVDDLSMGFVNVYHARMSLQKFIETQMQSGDLVAIMRTSTGIGALQLFNSDRKQLLKVVGDLRWDLFPNDPGAIFDAQLSTIRYCIQGMKTLPGRKSIFLITAQTTLPGDLLTSFRQPERPNYRRLYIEQYNRLADEALRGSAVIHTLDIRGLETPTNVMNAGVADRGVNVFNPMDVLSVPPIFRESENAAKLLPLSEKTGGVFLKDSNFFVNGIGRAYEELKGYYLLSYVPSKSTFLSSKKDLYHRIRIRVKRPGTQVHTRDGFFASANSNSGVPQNQDELQQAIYSPFQHNDLKVDLTSGYINDPKDGYVLRSWLYLDGGNLEFTKETDGGRLVSLEAAGITSDLKGAILDSGNARYEVRVSSEELPLIREEGIRVALSFPAKKPGAYYVRVAMKDKTSGKIGSAYQFIDIPDLNKDRLALSSIFITNQSEDLVGSQSETNKSSRQSIASGRIPSRGQGFRSYLSGQSLEFRAVIYNARSSESAPPDLQSQSALFKNGEEVLRGPWEPIDPQGLADLKRIPIGKKLQLDDALQPGDYVFQLQVQDKRAKKNENIAAQTTYFQIRSK